MKKIVWLFLCCLMAVSVLLASCGGDEEEKTAATEEETAATVEETATEDGPVVTVDEEKEWWDKWGEPQYGGTLTLRLSREKTSWDPFVNGSGTYWYETLAMRNFAEVDHDVYDFKIRFTPLDYYTGKLAESWDLEAWDTYVFHIRQGVYWQNKPPVNGREFDAYDVEWSWHRFCGIGSGFDEPSAYASMWRLVESVTAIDKWTVVFKTKEPSLYQFGQILDDHFYGSIVPREAVELWGDVDDWTRVIGTGPFMPVDYVESVSLVAEKNPNYWGYDEHFPDNRLPYIDGIKLMIIPDASTARAALRTGKIDWMGGVEWEHMQLLSEQVPELWKTKFPTAIGGTGIFMQIDVKPFDDIKVRKAMQMAIDLQTIADSYFGGTVDGTPPGFVGTPGYSIPYEEWPQEVKDGYAYNPEGAKELLAEAGYPDGLQCNLVISSSSDLDLAQIVQAYFEAIGIDMTIDVMESTVFNEYTRAGKAPMTWQSACYCASWPPVNAVQFRTPYHSYTSRQHIDDPVYNDIYERMSATFDEKEQAQLGREADLYAISKHWTVTLLPRYSYSMLWSWVKGYNGEVYSNSEGQVYSRLWIDQDLKKSMGY